MWLPAGYGQALVTSSGQMVGYCGEHFERVFRNSTADRPQWRDHSGNYLQALLVQDQERRNAENLSEGLGPGDAALSP